MMKRIRLETRTRQEMMDITPQIERVVQETGVQEGVCLVHVPHTTGGITINEGADPDVPRDIMLALDTIVEGLEFRHAEGNSDAHVKSTIVGCTVTIPVSGGRLQLGTWQRVFFCEFDGPRQREVWVTVQDRRE